MSQINGMISQVIGPVVDVSFEAGSTLPNILDALVIKREEPRFYALGVIEIVITHTQTFVLFVGRCHRYSVGVPSGFTVMFPCSSVSSSRCLNISIMAKICFSFN